MRFIFPVHFLHFLGESASFLFHQQHRFDNQTRLGPLFSFEEEEARRRAAEADDFLLDIDIDEDLPEDGQSLQDRLDELRDRLADLELEEPDDMFSEEYFAWEEAHEHLEERISELEDQIEGF